MSDGSERDREFKLSAGVGGAKLMTHAPQQGE
jgi:hypothetical protein